jgi:hypothetical protein
MQISIFILTKYQIRMYVALFGTYVFEFTVIIYQKITTFLLWYRFQMVFRLEIIFLYDNNKEYT